MEMPCSASECSYELPDRIVDSAKAGGGDVCVMRLRNGAVTSCPCVYSVIYIAAIAAIAVRNWNQDNGIINPTFWAISLTQPSTYVTPFSRQPIGSW